MIKSVPSETAFRVALSLVTLNAREKTRRVMPEGLGEVTEELLVSSGIADRSLIRRAKQSTTVRLGIAVNPWMSGQFQAFAYRKAFCERAVLDAISAQASQVLVLGAGYDTLCWRLAPDHPNTRFFEIDHPATSAVKIKGITNMGLRENMHMISADLSGTSLLQLLADEPLWDIESRSIIVAEGLLMYLRPRDVLTLFNETASSTGKGSGFAFSHFFARRNGRADLGLFGDYALVGLRLLGEPVRWAIRKDQLPEFIKGSGWQRAADDQHPAPDRAGIEGYVLMERL